MQRNQERFDAAAEQMRVGKLSGAVGTFGHIKPEQEDRICARLGLSAAPVATQVIQRDRHAYYVATLAVMTATLDKIATEIRHLQRTEVREAEEYLFGEAEGLVGDAAQAEPDHGGADLRAGAGGASQLAGGAGKCGAVA